MKKNLLDLARRMETLSKAIPQAASKRASEVAVGMVEVLAYNTPVDTSQALSNWQTSVGGKPVGTLPAFVEGRFGSTQHASAQSVIADAVSAVTNKKPGTAIYIVNNLDYIVDLNNGTISRQPGGFVERALLKGRLIASKPLKL